MTTNKNKDNNIARSHLRFLIGCMILMLSWSMLVQALEVTGVFKTIKNYITGSVDDNK